MTKARMTVALQTALFLIFAASRASATIINFDEFTSPPVTCCYGNPVVGPLVYPSVTITDGAGQGQVMNGSGWDNEQTSGNNLFGTESGKHRPVVLHRRQQPGVGRHQRFVL
jgi:hypothetical protein